MPKPTPPGGRTDLLHLGRPAGGCGGGGQCGCSGHGNDPGSEQPETSKTESAGES